MIKNIVFDMDGVLLDTEAVFMRCWKKLGEELHLPNVEETARKCIGINMVRSIRAKVTWELQMQFFTDRRQNRGFRKNRVYMSCLLI